MSRNRIRAKQHSILACAALLAVASWACKSPPKADLEVEQPDNGFTDSKAYPKDKAGNEYIPGSIIVKFKDTPTPKAANNFLASIKGSIEDRNGDGIYDRFATVANGRLALIELDAGVSTEEALAQLHKDPAVEYAHLNHVIRAAVDPNDAHYGDGTLWGLNNTGQDGGTAGADISAAAAWDSTIGDRSVVVAVIDTGLNYNHPDLVNNAWTNPNEIPGNGVDDDANGYVDDVHGINVSSSGGPEGDPFDDQSHGSHCSGTVGAEGNNNEGVVGVNWEVSIMGVKFLSSNGSGSTAGAIESVNYVNMMSRPPHDHNVRITSNSWGGRWFRSGPPRRDRVALHRRFERSRSEQLGRAPRLDSVRGCGW